MTKRSYNVLAMKGYTDMDDMDYVESYNLDPALAYTPEINEAILKKVYDKNIEMYLKKGMSQQQAERKAGMLRKNAQTDIQDLLKKY